MGKKTDKGDIEADAEPNFSDPEDYVDDIPEEGFSSLLFVFLKTNIS